MSPLFNNFNINLIDGTTSAAVALILIAGGGGTFAVVRRTQRHTRQADPEAIELDVTHAVERRAARGSGDDAGIPENTVAAEDASAAGQGGAVEGDAAFSAGDDEGALEAYGVGALEDTGTSDVVGTLEVYGAVQDDVAFGVPAST